MPNPKDDSPTHSKTPKLKAPKRLFKTFEGHYHQLLADFHRSAAHKLPGGKGSIREDAIAKFLSTWIPKRYQVLSNVFVSTKVGSGYHRELDIVIHDGFEGVAWPLDAGAVNSVVTWEHVRLVAEIKSNLTQKRLDDAIKAMTELTSFRGQGDQFRVLFAYTVPHKIFERLLEDFIYKGSDQYPFDAFVFLDRGVFISERFDKFRIAFEGGLTPESAEGDQNFEWENLKDFITLSHIPNGFRQMQGGRPAANLFAFATLATFVSAGDDTTRSLLAACREVIYKSIYDEGPNED